MTTKTITVKDIDQKVFLEFKAEATRKGLTVGKEMTKALQHWLTHGGGLKRKSIFSFKPWDWGPGTEKSSKEINKVLYGAKS